MKMKKIKKKPINYIDKPVFLEAMRQHKEKVKQYEIDRVENPDLLAPMVSNYIGDCLLKIAKGISSRPNFSRYPFREEMEGDGIQNCLQYINNFDPALSNNPFGYFSKIIWFAFLRRIEKEHTNLYTKYKMIQNNTAQVVDGVDGAIELGMMSDHSEYSQDYMSEFIINYERKRDEKRAKTKLAAQKKNAV